MLKILKSVEVEVIESTTRGDVLLDLLLTISEDLIRGIKMGGGLGCSDHAM